jgi:hypothetical protein
MCVLDNWMANFTIDPRLRSLRCVCDILWDHAAAKLMSIYSVVEIETKARSLLIHMNSHTCGVSSAQRTDLIAI